MPLMDESGVKIDGRYCIVLDFNSDTIYIEK